MTDKKTYILRYWPGMALLCLSLLIGALTYKDYGIAWDEPIERGIGLVCYNYAFNGDKTLLRYDDRDLGTGFELPLIFIEKGLHLTDSRDIYLMRHIVTHIFFLLSVFCGYVLVYRLFKNQFIACLGFMMLAFNPRIYAHSYFNTKDIPFLSVFIIVFTLCHIAFEKNKPACYLLLGLACGYATSIRVMGIMLFPIISMFFLFDVVRNLYLKDKALPVIINFLLFTAGFCGLLYAAWPILWSAPVHYFVEEYNTQAHIFWHGVVLFNGSNVTGENLPWNYLPVWFAITTPELWLLAGIGGFVWMVAAFIKKPMKYFSNTPERNFILYLYCFAVPVIALLVLHSVNYDDWRHVYFIYPSFVLLALFAINKMAQGRKKMVVYALCFLQLAYTGIFMVRFHPFQQVYFNRLVSHDKEYLRKHYDFEYWGCSYKQGLDYILAHDSSSAVRVSNSIDPVVNAVRLLPAAERKRVVLVDQDKPADYFITNFRNHADDYDYPETIYEIRVLNSAMLKVYKMHY